MDSIQGVPASLTETQFPVTFSFQTTIGADRYVSMIQSLYVIHICNRIILAPYSTELQYVNI